MSPDSFRRTFAASQFHLRNSQNYTSTHTPRQNTDTGVLTHKKGAHALTHKGIISIHQLAEQCRAATHVHTQPSSEYVALLALPRRVGIVCTDRERKNSGLFPSPHSSTRRITTTTAVPPRAAPPVTRVITATSSISRAPHPRRRGLDSLVAGETGVLGHTQKRRRRGLVGGGWDRACVSRGGKGGEGPEMSESSESPGSPPPALRRDRKSPPPSSRLLKDSPYVGSDGWGNVRACGFRARAWRLIGLDPSSSSVDRWSSALNDSSSISSVVLEGVGPGS